jgi:nucleotide-binding universal stress UspA family protein
VVDRQRALRPDAGGDWPGVATRLGRAAAPLLVVRRASSQPYRTVLLPYVSRSDAERLQAVAARWFDGSHWEWFQLAPRAAAHEWPPPVIASAPGGEVRHSDYLSSRRNRRSFMRGVADPVEQIVNQAQYSETDLVIVTAPRAGVGRRLLRRTFQERLARRLGCDLLVLPAEEAGASPLHVASAQSLDAGRQKEPGTDTLPVLLAWTDLSPRAEALLEKAGSLAAAQGLRLRLGYCRTTDVPFDAPLARLKQRARHLRRLFERPVEVIEQEIRTLEELRHQLQQCTLSCVAQASTPGHVDVLHKLLQLRIVPVLVFKTAGDVPYDRILVPVSLMPDSAELVRWAQLGGPQAQVELLHVCESPGAAFDARASTAPLVLDYYLARARQEVQRRMHALLPAGWAQRSGKVLAYGDVGTQIATRQRQGGHALVIVGATRRPAWLEFFRPSLARRLCRVLLADVLVVPQPAPSWREWWRHSQGSAS